MPISDQQVPSKSSPGGGRKAGNGAGGRKPPTKAELGVEPRTIEYEVDVKPGGTFRFKPAGTWAYRRGDRVSYCSETGPFTIEFKAKPGTAPALASPWDSGEKKLRADGPGPKFMTPQVVTRYPKADTDTDLVAKGDEGKKWKDPVTYNYLIKFDPLPDFPNGIDNTKHNGSVDC